jgi:antitoxin component HigA of HigAB toxin-antitoxin module
MNIHSHQDYQKALDLVQTLMSKGIDQLTEEEKTQLNSTVEAIEAYKLETESMPRAAAIP